MRPIVYLIRPDGSSFRRIASKPGWCLGSPKWSPDGKRVVFYELPTEDTWGARRPNLVLKTVSQIVSVDVASGERIVHSSGPGLKLFPHFLNGTVVAYHRKGGASEGLAYTTSIDAHWALLMLDRVVDRLRAEFVQHGRLDHFNRLKVFLLDQADAPYATLAREMGTSEGALKVAIHRLRKRYRDLFRQEIAETVADGEEVESELRYLAAALTRR